MFKMRIQRPNFKPKVGLCFVYNGQQFKVIRIHATTGNLYFAWWDARVQKVLTNNMEEEGMEVKTFSYAIHRLKYTIIDQSELHPKEFREFTLF